MFEAVGIALHGSADRNIATIGWMVMRFCSHIHGPYRMNPTDSPHVYFNVNRRLTRLGLSEIL